MAPFDPILQDHERRSKRLAASRRALEEQMIALDAMETRHRTRMERFREFIAEQIQYEMERERKLKAREVQSNEWQDRHELAMRQFDDKLNGLIVWLNDFVKRDPKT